MKSQTIILAEPNALLSDLIAQSLESDALEMISAKSIDKARWCMQERHPKLVIVRADLPRALELIQESTTAGIQSIVLANSPDARDVFQKSIVIEMQDGVGGLLNAVRSALGAQIAPRQWEPLILVVDDDESVRRMLLEYLRERHYATIGAKDGDEALQILAQNPDIAVILLDILMPGKGGMDTLAEISKRKHHPAVIMISAVADSHIAKRALGLGAFDYVTKPPDLVEVESAISACIARASRK